MSSSKIFRDFVLDQLKALDNITCRSMMGEFLLYYKGILFGGIYDDRLLIKKTNSNKKYCLNEEIPYEKGRPMYMVEYVDERIYLKNLIVETCEDLKEKD